MNIFKEIKPEVCRKDQADSKTAFVYGEMKIGEEITKDELSLNYLLFVLDGDLEVSWNEFERHHFRTNEMVLLRRSSSIRVKAAVDTTLYVMYFDAFLSSCDRHLYRSYLPDLEKTIYDFRPIAIPSQVRLFFDNLRFFQERGINCMQYNSIKHCELFLLLRNFCSREDIIMLLAPVIGHSFDFRTKVLSAYAEMDNSGGVSELADKVGMGRKNFDKHFRQEFGLSPAKWMLQEKAKQMKVYLTQPGVTIPDTIDKFHFNSPTHFNRFCHQYFNASPKVIINEAKQSSITDTV